MVGAEVLKVLVVSSLSMFVARVLEDSAFGQDIKM